MESRIQSQAWALIAMGMTQGITTSPRSRRRAPNFRLRISAQGTPMSSFISSVPNVYLKVFSSDEQEVRILHHPGAVGLDLGVRLDQHARLQRLLLRRPVREGTEADGLVAAVGHHRPALAGPMDLPVELAHHRVRGELGVRGAVHLEERDGPSGDDHRRSGSALPWGVVSSLAERRAFWNASASSRVGSVTRTRSFTLTSELTTLE